MHHLFSQTLPEETPKTVEDALHVAISLGIPFLWVDRYCIDQDNHHEKHGVIRTMDRIYHAAELTIIAAAGDGPHYGLPGIHRTPRKPQYQLHIKGKTFTIAEDITQQVEESRWNSRGWYVIHNAMAYLVRADLILNAGHSRR